MRHPLGVALRTGRQAASGTPAASGTSIAGGAPSPSGRPLPRFFIVQTFYPEFLKSLYAAEPELASAEFEVQCARLFGSAFSTSDAYSHNLRALGCEALEVICNADEAQARWATENRFVAEGNAHQRRRAILAAQIERFDPDVIYVFEWSPLGDEFVASLRRPGRLVVGEIASPLPPDRTFAGYDLMISSWPPIVDYFRSIGIDAQHIRLGFDERILDKLPPTPPRLDVSFVGGFAPSHPDRAAWLEEILATTTVDVFCYGLERTAEDSPIRRHFRGQAWGWDMYRALHASRITLNRHARLDVRGAVDSTWVNNMRMYEATGVGTCLLTERRLHLDKLFTPDGEVVTYADTVECIEKIRYYIAHEEERAAIAAAGQRRTLREHTYARRMGELLGVVAARLGATELPITNDQLPGTSYELPVTGYGLRVTADAGRLEDSSMCVGIWVSAKPSDGGIYQYTITLLEQLHQLASGRGTSGGAMEHEFVIFTSRVDDPALARFVGSRWSIQPCRPAWSPSPSLDFTTTPPLDSPVEQTDMRAWFEECGVDLMLFPSPHRLSFECGLPFVMCIHDLQHVLQPEFPEVSAGGEWARREYMLRNAARTATLLVAESAVGREDILRNYARVGITTERVKFLPYLPSATNSHAEGVLGTHQPSSVRPEDAPYNVSTARLNALRRKLRLPERYLFYPAQFWPHKNHLRIVEALARLRSQHDLRVPLVLSGSSSGEIRETTLAMLRRRIADLGLESQVMFLGYIPVEDVAALYTGAAALIMPTFFGPTNIPFLEAWAMECPVITSRVRGIVEQVGDAAITVDPTSVFEIADGIRRVWTDENVRRQLILRGRARLGEYGPNEYRSTLRGILDAALELVDRNKGSRSLCGHQ